MPPSRRMPLLVPLLAAALVMVGADVRPLAAQPKIGDRPILLVAESSERAALEARARHILSQARQGRAWMTPRGVRRWPIMVGSQQHGTLWEDVDLRSVGLGDHWQAGWSSRIELMHEGRVVGMLRIDDE